MEESYLEKCVQSLPANEQSAARDAFKAIAENGDDSLISKLLVTLKATSAYAESIPAEITRSGETILRNLDERTTRAAQAQMEADAQREKRLCDVIAAQLPQLGKALSMDEIAANLTSQTAELGRIERSLVRLRHARVSGLVFVLLFGFFLGVGSLAGVFWHRYEQALQARKFVDKMQSLGVEAMIESAGREVRLTIKCPSALQGTGWRKNDQGYIAGANFVIPTGGEK